MHTITTGGTYEEGEAAGEKLLQLFADLDVDVSSLVPPSESQLEKVFDYIWSKGELSRPFPVVKGFLSKVLRRDEYSADIIDVCGASSLIDHQQDWAPMCGLPADSGLIQFASWTGDMSDGDAWCIDILEGRVVCIPVRGLESRDEALRHAYGFLPDFHYLEAYLRCSAEQRGWL